MPESLTAFFSSEFFMPHGHCYLWRPALVWLQVLSNTGIGLAYVSIFATLVYLVRRIRNIPFQWMYVAFAIFIVTCGFTHFFDVYVIWTPAYWLDGGVRAITALASIGTAVLLPPLVPKAVALAEAASLAQHRGIQLEKANEELAALLGKTKELERLKTEFFANVSHELRTPLALILGPAEKLLAGEQLGDEQRRDLELIERNARSLLKQVNDLLDVSKLEAGKMLAEPVDADMADVVRLVAANFDGLAQENAIAWSVELPESLPARLDSDKFSRVVLNLLSNAFKLTPSGGSIRCTLRHAAEPSTAVLEVADSGPGVRPEHRAIIFERFRQADGGATRAFGGTGLGLAIAKDFLQLQGGTIQVGDAPEGGALFTVRLPVEAPAEATPHAAPPTAEVARAAADQVLEHVRGAAAALSPTGAAGKPLVLVVEDHPEMNRFISETLSPEYRIAVAFDGRSGLEKALELEPDLIVSDVMMPGLSGDELVRRIRAHAELATTPIMLLTAKADDDLRVRLLREGAQDYVMKPFSPDELRARAANLVTMKRARDVLQSELESQMSDLETLAREVTSRKRELQTALDTTRVARDQAQRASQLKSSFLGMVSHEFRTPVAALELQLERLRRDLGPSLTERQQGILERVSTSAGRLMGLIESLLQHTQIESGRLTINVVPFDVGALAAEVVEELRERAEHRGLELRCSTAPGIPELSSDVRLVRLILVNLLDNAIKFTERGAVTLDLSQQSAAHYLRVTDTGPGIPREAHARVFQPFTQLEEVRAKHLPGVGLGLALVKEMVEAIGGRIELSSEVGAGSTFSVILPPPV